MSELKSVEKNIAEFTVTVDAATFDEGMAKAYKKMVGQFNIPGFRKGKAPRKIIEQQYTEAVFYDEAINIVLPDAYEKAVEELKLDVIDRPEIDVTEVGKGKELVVTAKVAVKPDVKVGNYKGIEIDKVEYNVSDEDIDAKVKELQERNARLVTVDNRPVADKDTAVIDFEGFKDGVAFDGGKGEDYSLVIGSGSFIPGFEEQLIGKNAGEDVEVNVTFPEDYHAEDLKGAAVVFKVKIKEIKFKELPELDDEFAKDVSEFDTLADLKADFKTKLEKDAEEKAKYEVENKVIEEVTKTVEVDVPPVMVENQLKMLMQDYDMRMQQQGLNLEKYLEITGSSIDGFKEQFKAQAESQVKTTLMLETVAKLENLEVSEEELDEKFKELAEGYKMDVSMIKMYINPADLKHDLVVRKAVEFIIAESKQK